MPPHFHLSDLCIVAASAPLLHKIPRHLHPRSRKKETDNSPSPPPFVAPSASSPSTETASLSLYHSVHFFALCRNYLLVTNHQIASSASALLSSLLSTTGAASTAPRNTRRGLIRTPLHLPNHLPRRRILFHLPRRWLQGRSHPGPLHDPGLPKRFGRACPLLQFLPDLFSLPYLSKLAFGTKLETTNPSRLFEQILWFSIRLILYGEGLAPPP